ncbi:MAG: flavin reductase family protein [Clostridia bacterium]
MNMNGIESKIQIKPSTFLNPVPVVMVTCGTMETSNIITLAWAGTVNSEPPMLSVSVRKERYSHDILQNSGVFAVNLVSEDLIRQCDYCGVKSGRDTDKFADLRLTKIKGEKTGVPLIGEAPASLECRVKQVLELGSHDLFLAEIENVLVSKELFDEKGAIDLRKAKLAAYNHGEYYALGNFLGFYGYSVANKDALERRMRKN